MAFSTEKRSLMSFVRICLAKNSGEYEMKALEVFNDP